ncbi:hypothetical protein C9439_00815 [archaeon SCG-AAA382B04]|nr:hypothetical protein C9439_00815 [archaeon SCG-AAA382B04]
MEKRKYLFVSMALIVVSVLLVSGCIQTGGEQTEAEFKVSNFELDKKEVSPGETIQVSGDVENVGGKTGDYTLKVKVNGYVEHSETVTLEPGNTETVQFQVMRNDAGTYEVELYSLMPAEGVGDLKDSFTVIKETAEFQVSNLQINPTQAIPDETIEISADVENIGEKTGDHTVQLTINGEEENTQTVTLEPGNTETVQFQVTKTQEGTYEVELDGTSGTFTIEKEETGTGEEPPQVTGLEVTEKVGQLDLEWDSIDNVDHYKIYRDGEFLNTSTTSTYIDKDVKNGRSYSYTVSLLRDSVEGPKSESVSGTVVYIGT